MHNLLLKSTLTSRILKIEYCVELLKAVTFHSQILIIPNDYFKNIIYSSKHKQNNLHKLKLYL